MSGVNSCMLTEKHDLPPNWVLLKTSMFVLQAKGSIKIGPFGSSLKKEFLTSGGYKVYGQDNVISKDFNLGDRYISHDRFQLLKTCELKAGDFVVSMMGTIGASAIVPKDIPEGIMDSHLLRIRIDNQKISKEFLSYQFQSIRIQKQIKQLSVGGIMAGLSSSVVNRLSFLLPPLPEQNRIVAVLETWDKAIDLVAKKIEVKKQIKKGLMQELLTGKKRLPGFNDNWHKIRLGDVCKFQNGYPFNSENFSDTEGVRIIRNRDLKGDSQIIFFSGRSIPKNYLVQDGDILIGMDGDFIACKWSGGPSLLNQRVGRLVGFQNSVPDFLFYKIQAPLKLIEGETSSTTVKHLSSSVFENCIITIPRETEQVAIGNILAAVDAEIDSFEQKASLLKDQKKYLLNNLITGKIRTPESLKV